MTAVQPAKTTSLQDCVDFVRERLGRHWVVGAPLGLGKPNHLINALYEAARADPSIQLDLFTALSLNPPKPAKGLKQRFLEPFVHRQFGDYPRLAYLADLDQGTVPANITISEFYFRSGSRLHDTHAQRHYVSSNYTHVARDMVAKGINLMVQMVAADPTRPDYLSLASNPDVTLDLFQRLSRSAMLRIAQLNEDMPYMGGDAEVPLDEFDLLLDGQPQRLFAVPRMPVSDPDFLIGLYASQLIRDGGTLQLGIGSLGDAVSYFTVLREQNNDRYRRLCSEADALIKTSPELLEDWGGSGPFKVGIYAASEMFMEGFLHLFNAGVLKRKVYDHAGVQNLLNEGLIGENISKDILEILWDRGLLPRQLDLETLTWLQVSGILRSGLSFDSARISMRGQEPLANDLADPAVRKALARQVLGKKLTGGAVMHAAFFLGSEWMYQSLRNLNIEQRALFRMTSVTRVNQLMGGEELDRAQRMEARFINTCMKMTLLGAAVSDQLADGQVVSGVGGQYNFVAMAHALQRGRSVLMLRSHRGRGSAAESNLVWEYPHATIPRHLRDLVVTEYGIADLRSANDEQVIQRLICVSDSRWQESLRQ
ncbi:MAG TPA: acetyl-CoA hydrolase/transferase C-terminal domain-containing protein, partial [Xanthomonadales bacterium]|nr:acetyl-CoA hydrolase/transferase C-terminal domain-containing protein [Xanthomonadales bacterium]